MFFLTVSTRISLKPFVGSGLSWATKIIVTLVKIVDCFIHVVVTMSLCVTGSLKDGENSKTPVALFKRPVGCAGIVLSKTVCSLIN